jgi:putative ABC transport system permease protein
MTTLGVVFGSFVLAASLSIGQGVQDTIERESHRSDYLRRITVHPQWRSADSDPSSDVSPIPGKMSAAKRERIRRAVREHTSRKQVAVTQEKMSQMAALEHVEAVVPVFWQSGYAIVDQQSQLTAVAGARPQDSDCRRRLVAGRVFDTASEPAALVSEFLLYRWGLIDDASVQGVLGKKVRVELRAPWHERGFQVHLVRSEGDEATLEETVALERIKQQLPATLDRFDLTADQVQLLRQAILDQDLSVSSVVSEAFTIVGVVRLATAEEQKLPWDPLRTSADLILPFQTASDLFFRLSGNSERGVDQAVVVVDDERNTKEVYQRISDLGMRANTLLEYIEQQRLIYLLIFGGMTCVAAVALLVAALGIANTMLMSVLERTREIGIMKAVGAGNAQLQLVFVIEGAIIGSLGGGLGVLLAWATSFPGDAWVRSMVARSVPVELKESLFVFPVWLVVVSLLFAVVVTTLAALYPARRAAKIDPVAALRHE